ncbi:MAG TPA: RNA polymerase sigma factor [Polyangiaceae bacterium]
MARYRKKLDAEPRCAECPASPGIEAQRHSRVRFVDDAALVQGVWAGNPVAMAEFHDRFALPVRRILWSITGPDHELADLHHDVFVRALQSIGKLAEPEALAGWVTTIAVHTARSAIEKRISRSRWSAWSLSEAPQEVISPDPMRQIDAREALRAIHALLDRLPVAERVAFALRYLEGLELTEVAEACEVSLATIKRRLARAEARFVTLARQSPPFGGSLRLIQVGQGGDPPGVAWTAKRRQDNDPCRRRGLLGSV